jgi:glutamyl-tRNA reductase
LHASGAGRIAVINRTYARAEELAVKFGGQAFPFDRLQTLLAEADVVITSTGSAQTILTKNDVEAAMRGRTSRSLFMIDIAVPRDLDPGIHDVPNVYLYDIDDLEGIVEANMELRRQHSLQIEAMIAEELNVFEHWYRSLGVGPVIRALQEKASEIHQETMESMRNKLPDLTERELKIIHKLTKSMLNQMMHDPIQRVKELAPERHGDEALAYVTKLFALEEHLNRQKAADALPESREMTEDRLPVKHGTLSLV